MSERRAGSAANTVLLALILIAVIAGCVALYGLLQSTLAPVQRAAELPGQGVSELQTRLAELQHPTPTIRPSPATIVLKIQNLSRLETAAYTVEKVITAEENQGPFGWLFGDRLLLVAHGQVIAGVDLGKMQPSDIIVTADNRVVVTLPAAEILVVKLDNQKSYVYQRDTGVFAGDVNLETEARRAAENEILDAALEDGILKLAQDNAQNVVRSLLINLGFTEVTFITATPVPTVSPVP
jgi:hypothetical protein